MGETTVTMYKQVPGEKRGGVVPVDRVAFTMDLLERRPSLYFEGDRSGPDYWDDGPTRADGSYLRVFYARGNGLKRNWRTIRPALPETHYLGTILIARIGANEEYEDLLYDDVVQIEAHLQPQTE